MAERNAENGARPGETVMLDHTRDRKPKLLIILVMLCALCACSNDKGPKPQVFDGPADRLTITLVRGRDNSATCMAKGGTWVTGDNKQFLNAVYGCIEPLEEVGDAKP
jgi:hypothetical protein